MRRNLGLTVGAVAAAALLAGCGGGGGSQPAPSSAPSGDQTLTVSAAASLTDVFNGLEKQFEQQNPGVDVRLNYGGSSDLAQQIVNGAPADVFAAANTSTMDTVSKAGLTAGTPSVFVTNTLQIAVAPGDPKNIHTFADLTKPDLKVVVCADTVPCGSATKQVEKATGVTLKPVSKESDVRAALTKVSTGDADAAMVYVTDVKSSNGKVQGVDFPEASKAINKYPIATLKNAPHPDLAAKWVALVEGPDGKKALSEAGFGTPS
ncbi:molybdate ABC transporter substrate-binding protein [Pseudonocardia spinosispora]|uniref:molybdate ABC transporter substrate-binding protein n=1 Tax=Pseudonocardia spinosispora TaxID=103441 RepID=UPI00041BB65B|nr:molybdate ABC transporter substrate-binding protein [Pseudonocardia spinosispora]